MTSLGLLGAIVSGALGGGFGVEVFRAWRDRQKNHVELEQASLDLFYPTWKEEMRRLHNELAQLRMLVLRLSDEVARLGGDPKSIIYTQENPDEPQ